MSDDAEFDAFLNGQGDLARSLQALDQSAPSAALDAAIMANARAALEQDARPQAANDGGAAAPAPQPARGLGWRWRIPAAIAATVLVGVFAQRNFEANPDLNDLAAPVMMEESTPAPALDVPAPAPPPPPAADETQAQAVANAAPAPAQKPAAPAAPRAGQSAPAMEAARQFADKAPAPQSKARAAQSVEKSAPAPAVQADKVPELDANHFGRDDTAPAYSPASAPVPAPAPPAAMAAGTEQVQVSARRRQMNDAVQLTPRAWLDRIEKVLAEGRRDEAVADWEAFRKAHPDYPVPDATRSKLE